MDACVQRMIIAQGGETATEEQLYAVIFVRLRVDRNKRPVRRVSAQTIRFSHL